MSAQRVDERASDGTDRVECRARILENDGKTLAIAAPSSRKIERAAGESDAAVVDASCRRQDTHDRKRGD